MVIRRDAEKLGSTLPPLLVDAQRIAASVAQGVHGRRRTGMGESFWQFRPYEDHDSFRSIDWRQSAKGDRLFVRQREWEAAQTVWMWSDGSASMQYRSQDGLPTKRGYGDLVLLVLAALLTRAGERAGLINSGQPAATGQAGWNRLGEVIVGDKWPREALPKFAQINPPVARHSHFVFISDFFYPPEELQRALKSFAGAGDGGHLLQVLDPAEACLPFKGRVMFQDSEQPRDETLIPSVETIRDRYIERMEEHRRQIKNIAQAAGWTFSSCLTDMAAQETVLQVHAALAGRHS